jgi:hypothetical protein
LYRLTACSERLPPATRRQLIQNKIKDIGAGSMVTDTEYLDFFPMGDENQRRSSEESLSDRNQAQCSARHEDYVLHFEKYCLDDLQLEETKGENQESFLQTTVKQLMLERMFYL